MQTDDENLLRQAARGDAVAFRALLERHYDGMFRLAFNVLGDRADAEDVVQEVCAKLPARLGGFRGEAKARSWLHSIVVNASRDLIRRRQSARKGADGWGDREKLLRAETAERQEELDWLASAMRDLKPDLRETVALVLGEEMTHADAAEVLKVSEGTVSWRMGEVRKALRALAESDGRLG